MRSSSSSHSMATPPPTIVPHKGSLCRVEDENGMWYTMEIILADDTPTGASDNSSFPSSTTSRHRHPVHNIKFSRSDFDFFVRLFSIMDTESRGQVSRAAVEEFVTLRCPVFWRRDVDLRKQQQQHIILSTLSKTPPSSSPTFEEVWKAVAICSKHPRISPRKTDLSQMEIGIEGWVVCCRFLALAQYLEAKRRFSGRHLQQTMRNRNSPRGSEVVVVDVPPLAPPVPLTPTALQLYEESHVLPLPELDLDHSLLSAHERQDLNTSSTSASFAHQSSVQVTLFGTHASSSSSSSSKTLEFCLAFSTNKNGLTCEGSDDLSATVVRRSMDDMKWLHDTFKSHKVLGGTLCGRILPPFPGNNRSVLSSQFQDDSNRNHHHHRSSGSSSSSSSSLTTSKTIAAGVGMLKQGFQTLWSSVPQVVSSPTSSNKVSSSGKKYSIGHSFGSGGMYYNPNAPLGKARHLERYLNYLLEHPALSTSFPLNTILKASQSGLDAAKQCLETHTRAAKEINDQAPQIDNGIPASSQSSSTTSVAASVVSPNLSWVRTAAQAAMALKVHGLLETTGLPTASARLQHASLPAFVDHASRANTWVDEEGTPHQSGVPPHRTPIEPEDSFEEGVIHVQDELESNNNEVVLSDENGGYDLLPLPVPAPERRILSLGGTGSNPDTTATTNNGVGNSGAASRFRYGSPTMRGRLIMDDDDDLHSAYLGEISVDENIDKLREVIGSVDNTLSRCLASSGKIGRSRREQLALHLDVIRGFDSWEGLKGKFVSQRALLKGVSGMEQSREVFEESDLALIDDVSWQTALATSAVSAAEDVRSTVRAARTAANAKATASSAALAAQTACESGKFATLDEARAAQTRASMAQSHAIHAAVVEHEAKTVKRRATMALAHDVKCWNMHRKREMLKTCISYARSQHEATRRAVDAWSCLRDGFIGSTVIPSAPYARKPKLSPITNPGLDASLDDVTTTIYGDINSAMDTNISGDPPRPAIVAIEHELLKTAPSKDESSDSSDPKSEEGGVTISNPIMTEPEMILPLVVASPIMEDEEEVTTSIYEGFGGSISSQGMGFGGNSTSLGMHFGGMSSNLSSSQIISPGPLQQSRITSVGSIQSQHDSFGGSQSGTSGDSQGLISYSKEISNQTTTKEKTDDCNEGLTSSLQSLVDGLMTWGGQYDSEEDLALPTGMAASIALEESGVLNAPHVS